MKGGDATQQTEHVVKFITFATKDVIDNFWRGSHYAIQTGYITSYTEPLGMLLISPDLLDVRFIRDAFDKLKVKKEDTLSEAIREGVRIDRDTRVYPIIIDYHSVKRTSKIVFPKFKGSKGTVSIFTLGPGNLKVLNDSVAKGLLIQYGEEDVPSRQVHTRKYLGQQGYQAPTKDIEVQQLLKVDTVLKRPIAQLFSQILTDSFYQDRGPSDDIYARLINPKQQIRSTLLSLVDKRGTKNRQDKIFYRRLSQKVLTIRNQSTLRSILDILQHSTEPKIKKFARINQLYRLDTSEAAQAGKMPAAPQAVRSPTVQQAAAQRADAQIGKMPAAPQAVRSPTVQQAAAQIGKMPAVQQGLTSPVQGQHRTSTGASQKPGSKGIYSRLSSEKQKNQRASYIAHLISLIPRIQAFVGPSRRVIIIDGINYLYKKYSKSFNELGDLDLFNAQWGITGSSSFFDSLVQLFNKNYERWSPGFDDTGGHAKIIWVMPSSKRGNEIDITSDNPTTMVIRCGYPTTTWRKNRNDDATVLMVAIAFKNEGKKVVIWSGDTFWDWIDKNTGNPIVKQLTVRRFQQLRR